MLHQHEAERESKAVLNILENLVVSIAPPPEFESSFKRAVKSIAKDKG